MEGYEKAQRAYDRMEPPEYYDERTDAEIEEAVAEEIRRRERKESARQAKEYNARPEIQALWDAVTKKRLEAERASIIGSSLLHEAR